MEVMVIVLFVVCYALLIFAWHINKWWSKWGDDTLAGWRKTIDLNDELLKDNIDTLDRYTKAIHFIRDKNLLTEFDSWEDKE